MNFLFSAKLFSLSSRDDKRQTHCRTFNRKTLPSLKVLKEGVVMKQELAFMVLLLVGSADSQYKGCDYFQAMKPGKLYSIATKKIGRSSNCRWSAEAPPGYRISLVCHEVNLPSTLLCRGDEIMVSISGRADLRGGKRHCGNASFIETTISRKITVALKSRSGELKCSLKAIANVSNSCTCGQQNRGRIGECIDNNELWIQWVTLFKLVVAPREWTNIQAWLELLMQEKRESSVVPQSVS